MDEKYIIKALRPLKIKIYLHKAVNVLLSALIIAGFISLIIVLTSLFVVIPFVRHKMFAIIGTGFFVALIASVFFIPSKKQLIITADSLGLSERVITSWCLIGDNSEVAKLQREDTKKVLQSTNLTSAYKITIEKYMYILAACVITAAILLTFIPSKVDNETQVRESLLQEINKHEKLIDEEIAKQEKNTPDISEDQLNQLKEALEKLKEEFKKSESEEDALKALSQMENLMDKLKSQEPLKDLNALKSTLSESLMTRDMMEGLDTGNEEALKEAMEHLEKELENEGKIKELAEMLQDAAMNIGNNSMVSEALQSLASAAASRSLSGNEIVQSLMELMQQTEENAVGQQEFENAITDLSEALGNARRSISAVDQRIAAGNAGQKSSATGQQGEQAGSGTNNNGQSGEGGQQTGNQGENGNGSQGIGAGAGAGDGTTNIDIGYNEGDEAGQGRMPGGRKEAEYRRIYVPERLGGEGNETALTGQKLDSGSSIYSEADGAPVKKGLMVPYQEVLSDYREEAVQTMERQEIPIGMKELVKSYFSSLN